MSLELKIDDRIAVLDIIARDGNQMRVKVDDREYELDLVMVEEGVYSIILGGRSYNIELIEGNTSKEYHVNTFRKSYDVEIIDAEAKYLKARNSGLEEAATKTIVSPMPGKVVKVLVKQGEQVTKGDTLIIISAMKMESEFKAAIDGVVKEVNAKDGDTVDGGKVLIVLE
jgi:biotin carboxyl carrier protein